MKKIIFFLCVIGAVFWYLKHQQPAQEVISNPVYADIRFTINIPNRNFEIVYFIETIDETECKKYSAEAEKEFQQAITALGRKQSAGMKMKSSECKSELPARYAKFFDNEPAALITYLSVAKGGRQGREIRVIPWGTTQEESDFLCEKFSEHWKNTGQKATCILAVQR